jgi:hypothetical protein
VEQPGRRRSGRLPQESVDQIIKHLPAGLHLVLIDPYKMEQLVFDTIANLAGAGLLDF